MALAKYTNTPPENQVSRRAVLAAPIAAGAAAIAPPSLAFHAADVGAVKVTPVMSLYHQWLELSGVQDALYAALPFDAPDEAYKPGDAMCDQITALERRILATPSETAEDFAAKLTAWSDYGLVDVPNKDHEVWDEARKLIGKGPVEVTTKTPVRRAYDEWLAFFHYVNAANVSDVEYDDLCDQRHELARAAYALPSSGPADILLKMLILNDNGNDFSDDCYDTGRHLLVEAKAMVAA